MPDDSMTREERTAYWTRERDRALAEWARVSAPGYRASPLCREFLTAWLVVTVLVVALIHFTPPVIPILPSLIGGAVVGGAIGLLGWYA